VGNVLASPRSKVQSPRSKVRGPMFPDATLDLGLWTLDPFKRGRLSQSGRAGATSWDSAARDPDLFRRICETCRFFVWSVVQWGLFCCAGRAAFAILCSVASSLEREVHHVGTYSLADPRCPCICRA
jgi:hypothetical protein